MGPRSGLDIQGEENPPAPIRIRTPARPGHSLDTNRYLLSSFCSNAWRLVYTHPLALSCLISECFILLDCVYPSTTLTILGAFEKQRKAVSSFVVSVCLSVFMERHGCRWPDFHEIWQLRIFCRENSRFIKTWQ